MTIWVSSRFHAPGVVREQRIARAVSLLAPYDEFPVLSPLGDGHHLKLAFDDIDYPIEDLAPPQPEHVEQLIRFVSDWDRASPMLIHCWAGVSRSTASAFITACLHNPDADEGEIARAIRAASDTAKPNRRLVEFADDILGRKGRMVDAVSAMGENLFTAQANPFSIPGQYPSAPARSD